MSLIGDVLTRLLPGLLVVRHHRRVHAAFGADVNSYHHDARVLSPLDGRSNTFTVSRAKNNQIDPGGDEIVDLVCLIVHIIGATREHRDFHIRVILLSLVLHATLDLHEKRVTKIGDRQADCLELLLSAK